MPADAKLVATLAAAHAAIGALLIELTESPPASDAPVPAPASGGGVTQCNHKNRKDLRAFGQAEHWECQDCGYEYRR